MEVIKIYSYDNGTSSLLSFFLLLLLFWCVQDKKGGACYKKKNHFASGSHNNRSKQKKDYKKVVGMLNNTKYDCVSTSKSPFLIQFKCTMSVVYENVH